MFAAAVATEVTTEVVVAVGAAAFLLGVAKGGLSGLGPMLTLLVAAAVPTSVAIGVLLPLLMIGDGFALWAHWGHWDRAILRRLLPGGLIGVAIASFFLRSLSETALRLFLAAITIAFVLYRLAEPRLRERSRRSGPIDPRWAGVAGSAAGITSTIAHVGGPPVSMYLLTAKVSPRPFVATAAVFFFIVNWLKVPGYIGAGLFEVDLLVSLAPTALLIPPGIVAGRWFVTHVPQRIFDQVILASLVVGAVLLVR